MTLDAAAKEMHTTRERVRQLQTAGLRKLRRGRISRMLSEKFEVNMAGAYSGSVTSFRYTWTSSTERVALKNLEIMEFRVK
jgi:RNA polymerase primary sigma factor